MIQICKEVIIIPLKLIFEQSLKKGKFPEIWKAANVAPVYKKEDKCLVKNYRPISLLPIFAKVFKRVIYNSLFNYYLHDKLLNIIKLRFPNQVFFQETHALTNCYL